MSYELDYDSRHVHNLPFFVIKIFIQCINIFTIKKIFK
jgi:hypothetical protein